MSDSAESIARDLADYLRENDGVCANGNVHGWAWIRFHDGEWQATRYYTGDSRLKSYVEGAVLDEETVISWLVDKPATIIPQSEAYLWNPAETTVWEDANDQDVFSDATRCDWCGESENTTDLKLYETVEDGDTHLCPSCFDSWMNAGEIVGEAEVTA